MLRERFSAELKEAMKAGQKRRVDSIRQIMAPLKDKDIQARGQGASVAEDEILALLQKMIKSRQEARDIYAKAGRDDLAQQEAEEIAVIETFLPQPLTEAEADEAIAAAIARTGAASIKDMGKVIASLKGEYAGRMDFAKASARVKAQLEHIPI